MRKLTALSHQFLGETETAVRAHHGERSDVAVLDAIGGLFFHFGEYVANDLGRVIGRFWGT